MPCGIKSRQMATKKQEALISCQSLLSARRSSQLSPKLTLVALREPAGRRRIQHALPFLASLLDVTLQRAGVKRFQ